MTADEFNAAHPVGTPVIAFPGTKEGRAMLTRTSTPAWDMGGHTPVVTVENYPGGIALTHIELQEQPRSTSTPRPHPQKPSASRAALEAATVPRRPMHATILEADLAAFLDTMEPATDAARADWLTTHGWRKTGDDGHLPECQGGDGPSCEVCGGYWVGDSESVTEKKE